MDLEEGNTVRIEWTDKLEISCLGPPTPMKRVNMDVEIYVSIRTVKTLQLELLLSDRAIESLKAGFIITLSTSDYADQIKIGIEYQSRHDHVYSRPDYVLQQVESLLQGIPISVLT